MASKASFAPKAAKLNLSKLNRAVQIKDTRAKKPAAFNPPFANVSKLKKGNDNLKVPKMRMGRA